MVDASWRVIINSIGTGSAGLISILKKVSPLSENRIASILYRGPAELIAHLPENSAKEIAQILQTGGLDCVAVNAEYTFTPGDSLHEVALVIHDFERIPDVIEEIMNILGVDVETARKIICTAPTVLIGNISASTVAALRKRFEPLGVELDVSRPDEALYDLFLGECTALVRQSVLRLLKEQNIPTFNTSKNEHQPLLAVELTKFQADQLWQRLKRSSYPARIVNRDFERFDLRLDETSPTPEMLQYLVESTGMPLKVAQKVILNTPIVLQQNVPFAELAEHLEKINLLGGKASGHLLAFQTFNIDFPRVTDQKPAADIIRFVIGADEAQVQEIVSRTRKVVNPLTYPQARWLQTALEKAGTPVKLVVL